MSLARLFVVQFCLWLFTLSPISASAITHKIADLQVSVGDLKLGEGSFEHAALHGLVGCAAGEALGGSCGSGAAAGIAQSIFAGLQEGEPRRGDFGSDETYLAAYGTWRSDVAAQANLLGAAVGYATSGGQAVNVSNAASIAKSGATNNYLSHTQLEAYSNALGACEGDAACMRSVFERYLETSLSQQHELAMCGNDLACLAPHLQAMATARDHPMWQAMVDALWGPYGNLIGELEYQAHEVYLGYDHDVGNPFPLSLFSGWLVREHGEAYGGYAGWSADHCSGVSGATCMREFQKIRTVSAYFEGYQRGGEAFLTSATIGLGGGLSIAVAPSAVATMRLCAANPLCWAEVAGAGGEIGLGLTGATAGQTFFTVAGQTSVVAGAVILKHGDEIIRVIDDIGQSFTPVSQSVDDTGRFILRRSDGATGYLDDSRQFVQTGAPNRTATQADVAGHFQQNRQFWTQDPIQFSGNKVFQRNDLIDPNHVSEWTVRGQTVRGTNIERMAAGRAPIGPDGNSVNLHHLTQQQNGAIAEVTQTLHSTNHGILHMPNTVPSGIDRAQFQTWSRNYWKQRAANWGE